MNFHHFYEDRFEIFVYIDARLIKYWCLCVISFIKREKICRFITYIHQKPGILIHDALVLFWLFAHKIKLIRKYFIVLDMRSMERFFFRCCCILHSIECCLWEYFPFFLYSRALSSTPHTERGIKRESTQTLNASVA